MIWILYIIIGFWIGLRRPLREPSYDGWKTYKEPKAVSYGSKSQSSEDTQLWDRLKRGELD